MGIGERLVAGAKSEIRGLLVAPGAAVLATSIDWDAPPPRESPHDKITTDLRTGKSVEITRFARMPVIGR